MWRLRQLLLQLRRLKTEWRDRLRNGRASDDVRPFFVALATVRALPAVKRG
jgi:hypothetical protein